MSSLVLHKPLTCSSSYPPNETLNALLLHTLKTVTKEEVYCLCLLLLTREKNSPLELHPQRKTLFIRSTDRLRRGIVRQISTCLYLEPLSSKTFGSAPCLPVCPYRTEGDVVPRSSLRGDDSLLVEEDW